MTDTENKDELVTEENIIEEKIAEEIADAEDVKITVVTGENLAVKKKYVLASSAGKYKGRLHPGTESLARLKIPENLVAKAVARLENAAKIEMKRIEGRTEVDAARRKARLKAKEKKKRRNKLIYAIVQSIMLAIMCFAVAKLFENVEGSVEGTEHRRAMEQYILSSEEEEPPETPVREIPAYPLATPKRIEVPESELPTRAQLQKLKDINDDFAFWLYIPDTEVSYYVLQGETNDTYLRADIYKKYLHSGSCFLDFRCNKETMEGHTIIYGHTMNDLSVFGVLREYFDEKYYNDHRYFYTCTTEGITMWKFYSVYVTTTDEYYIETWFENKASYLDYITVFANKSMHSRDLMPVADDDVLTFSTCYRPNGGEKGRLVMHAIKIGTVPQV